MKQIYILMGNTDYESNEPLHAFTSKDMAQNAAKELNAIPYASRKNRQMKYGDFGFDSYSVATVELE